MNKELNVQVSDTTMLNKEIFFIPKKSAMDHQL
jgi:hypothetical protein